MDFNKILLFKNNNDIVRLSRRPNKLYKYYAKRCNFKEWLKIYKINKRMAMYIHKWMKKPIFIEPFHIKIERDFHFSDHEYTEYYKNLEYFLTDQWSLQAITTDHNSCSNKFMKTIQKMENLNKLSVENVHGEICQIELKFLEKLSIIGQEEMQVKLSILNNLPNLKELSLKNITINKEIAESFKRIKLVKLKLDNVSVRAPVNTMNINTIIMSTGKLIINNCHIIFHQLLLHNCFANTLKIRKLEIDIPEFPENFSLDYTILLNASSLAKIKIKIFVCDENLYQTCLKLLATALKKRDCYWFFDIKVPYKYDSDYLNFYQRIGHENQESFVQRLYEITEAAKEGTNLHYTIRQRDEILFSHLPTFQPNNTNQSI